MRRRHSIEINPIKPEADYEAALKEIYALFEAEPDTPESDRLDVLATLVEAYEKKHYPIGPPDPIEALRYFIASRGFTPQDLAPYIGSASCIAEILERRRFLTLNMIRGLEISLGIPADLLAQPYELSR